ncbi:MAG: hypothetical protein CL840_06435 [Crocinitomicaceae bacterium]|nr:hypothetical protein [Crocinitomicaceae bacterium]|tara:strand:+ start:1692 stop:2171 length:480 start_codon:yes stop_codon:yes gene_type:complete
MFWKLKYIVVLVIAISGGVGIYILKAESAKTFGNSVASEIESPSFTYQTKYVVKNITNNKQQVHLNIRVYTNSANAKQEMINQLISDWIDHKSSISIHDHEKEILPKEKFIEDFHGMTNFKSLHVVFEIDRTHIKSKNLNFRFSDLADESQLLNISINT